MAHMCSCIPQSHKTNVKISMEGIAIHQPSVLSQISPFLERKLETLYFVDKHARKAYAIKTIVNFQIYYSWSK